MNYCTIYWVRHGETEYNLKEIIQGQADSPLTELGLKQAKQRAEKLMHVKFDAVFSSDLPRAAKTAEILKLDRQLVVNTTKLLRERDYGPFDGKPASEYREKNKQLLEKRNSLSIKEIRNFKLYEGFETDNDFVERILLGLREIAAAYPGKTVLVVGHGGSMRVVLVHLGYATYEQLPPGRPTIDNLAVIKLESDGVDFFVKETEGVNKQNIN